MRLVLACGCFDLLHPGHVRHLEEARAMGDSLTVALTLDAFVGKPGRPIQSWEERAYMLLALRCVDTVTPSSGAPLAIMALRPAVYVKGPDYRRDALLPAERAACEEVGAVIRFTSAPAQSTTDLIRRIKCA